MAQVIVAIAGRTYRMSCEDGQEAHIEALAADLDARMTQLRESFGEIGEQRLTMMTALTVVDELSDIKRRLRRAEDELGETRRRLDEERARNEAGQAKAAERLEAVAHKIVTLAEALARG